MADEMESLEDFHHKLNQ